MAAEIRFCDGAGGSGVKKYPGFSAPQGRLAVAPRDFLRRKVVWQ